MRLGTDLAGVAADVLVTALATPDRVRVRERFARWFQDQNASSYARQLLDTGAAEPDALEPLRAVWAPRLRVTLVHAADKNAAARQLRELVQALAPLTGTAPPAVTAIDPDAWPDTAPDPRGDVVAPDPRGDGARGFGPDPDPCPDTVPYSREGFAPHLSHGPRGDVAPGPRGGLAPDLGPSPRGDVAPDPGPGPRGDSAPDLGPDPRPDSLPDLDAEIAPPPAPEPAPHPVSEPLPQPRPPLTGDHVDFRQAEIHGPVIGVQIQHSYGARPPIALPGPGDWPTATALEPLAHGVRAARRMRGRPPLPPYVPRDADAALVSAVESVTMDGGLVVVLGEPYAGKSRTALAVLASALPQARVYAPDAGTDLRRLPDALRGATGLRVLWLDDLGGHLGDGGLDPRLLARLAGLKAVVVATLREDDFDEYRQTPRGRVLDLAQVVELPRQWSQAERARAAESPDPRLTEAAALSGAEGVAAHLAVEPRLWADFQHARRRHPRGQALVRAAVDLARCGLLGPLPQDMLVEVADGYGPPAGPEPESVEEALEWAARERYGVLPLLRRAGPRAWAAAGPLVSTARCDETFPPVDGALWQRALDVARTVEGHDVELVATLAGAAFERAIRAGDRRAMYRLGLLEEAEGHQEEAESWFRRAAEAGVPEAVGHLGRFLRRRADREAEPFLEQAAEAGDGDAATLLAEALLERAEHWLRAASTARAQRLLGDLRFCADDPEQTWLRYTNAADPRDPDLARSMGMHHLVVAEPEFARAWLQRAVDAGDTVAAQLLRVLGREGPSLNEAEEYFRDTDGYPLDIAHHGAVLERLDRTEEAEAQYKRAYEAGDAYGAYRLGALLDRQGEPDQARAWYRKAAGLGHHGARKALGEVSGGPDTVGE
ncbi:hypothetical protein [Streptomyces sp. SID161]|uniref:hypothetical protein n=1 Tax=Streptomyces sp. SID161 TaxID=2690251 RepID=UPI00136AF701|nr:hypothetical protein [Streptomyces sp. SID161]MYW45417.1 hypothetical protein [Streptomyces sp. SID161]